MRFILSGISIAVLFGGLSEMFSTDLVSEPTAIAITLVGAAGVFAFSDTGYGLLRRVRRSASRLTDDSKN